MIDIKLSENDKKDSENILSKYFSSSKKEEIYTELERLIEVVQPMEDTCKISYISKFDFFQNWFLKRNIIDLRNIMFGTILNKQEHSKDLYEQLALNESELANLDLSAIVLNRKKLARTSIFTMRRELARRTLDLIDQISPKSIIEFGCGEGLVLLNIMLMRENFLKNKSWTGFDYSIARSIRAKVLFELFHLTKDEKVFIYNGDGKKVLHQDKEFDVATCCAVIEQLKYEKHEFLSEMGRVAKYSIIQEPLYSQQTCRGKIHFRRNDYVHLKISDIEKVGEILDIKHYDLNDPTYALSTILVKNY